MGKRFEESVKSLKLNSGQFKDSLCYHCLPDVVVADKSREAQHIFIVFLRENPIVFYSLLVKKCILVD